MCGIVGYVGKNDAKDIIIDGLRRLEYRGYDSAGIAIANNGEITVRKHVGEISNLEKLIGNEKITGTTGIGHTRWATHGAPSDANSHPHINENCSVAIVHNGIIENYTELKHELKEKFNIEFKTETDSEVIAMLISSLYSGDLKKAVMEATDKMRGAYAIAAIAANRPDELVAHRKDAPLIVGVGDGCNFVASDFSALVKHTDDVYLLENDDTVVLKHNKIEILDKSDNLVKRDMMHIGWSAEAAEKSGYEHFMIKEIIEQPKAIKDTINRRLNDKGKITFNKIDLDAERLSGFNKIYIVACGTAYHAGLVGRPIIEKMTQIPVEVDVASEFRYRDPFVDEKTLFIAISQSGETSDTLAAIKEARSKGARIMSIVNVVGSSVSRESDDVIYTWAGPEIAVASTKAYTTQLVALYMLALYMGDLKRSISTDYYFEFIKNMNKVPDKLEKVIENREEIEELAKALYSREKVFYIGRGLDSTVCYEGSLKLKEISYINSFAIAAGELKHGTIALMDPDTIVIALATQDRLYEKMVSNIQEVKSRRAYVIAVSKEGNESVSEHADKTIYIPNLVDDLTPLISVVPLQLFAYYVAKERGCNIDKPKNLAKSVTVE
ncbi:MAG TPA: glutamine--fructose-6-phosphate transaminase (isomerizing) [Anaerovoracaceae bacterium]|nr:glutamine--fructose-6-phosphate transaminase (isomerizing) [Anaerovoracaceae bacterium]